MTKLPTGNDPWLVLIPEPCLGSVLESCRQPEPKLCRDCEYFNNQDSSRTVLRPVLWFAGGDDSSEPPFQPVIFCPGEMASWICMDAH